MGIAFLFSVTHRDAMFDIYIFLLNLNTYYEQEQLILKREKSRFYPGNNKDLLWQLKWLNYGIFKIKITFMWKESRQFVILLLKHLHFSPFIC